jgi:uncharacterized NAD-dependent epimerase/dehydratase family protein
LNERGLVLKIVVLDSGVRFDHPKLKEKIISGYGLEYDSDTKSVIKTENFSDSNGHGTAVASILSQRLPGDCGITMVKIFGDDMSMPEESFCGILEYIRDNESCGVLNLSLGLTLCHDIERLRSVCKEISGKGTIIVSAFDNCGAISYPAAFDFVIGVDGADDIFSGSEYEWIDSSIVNIRAKGGLSRLAWVKPDYIIAGGTSFACAYATAIIACQLSSHAIEANAGLSAELRKRASARRAMPLRNPRPIKPDFIIRRAATFPFNKEIHSLLRFSSLLGFEIDGAYDERHSGKVGASLNALLETRDAPDMVVRNIDDISWDSIDTLILGHADKLENIVKKNLALDLVNEALLRKKSVYSFDPVRECKGVFTPIIDEGHVPYELMGKLNIIGKPVLGVFGTSSRQGKFTLQLALRDKLQKKGYDVRQIGTEPSSLLFGMDFAYPFGYNKTADLSGSQAILLLNDKMRELSQKSCDIIITGSQSGTVPYSKANIALYPTDQISFLYGTSPDAVILAINTFDDAGYIKRTISFIEGAVDCKVIALSIFPKRPRNNYAGLAGSSEFVGQDELARLKKAISKKFGIFAGILGNEHDMDSMVGAVISYFGDQRDD